MTTKDDEYALLRSATLQNAISIRTARERAEQRQEAYWAEAQRLSHTGSFGWNISTREIVWSCPSAGRGPCDAGGRARSAGETGFRA
jgi:hypothetical protein